MREPCPICGSQLIDHIEWVDANGCLLEYSQCSGCRSEIADADQINRNAQRRREVIGKPIHVWIDEWALESLKERDRQITLRKKLYGKPTRKGNKWKRKILSGY